MAHIANSAPIAWPLGAIAAVGRFFEQVYLSLSIAASYDSRMLEIERLQQLSDERLAAKGLKREDIVRHVYSDLFYV